MKETWFYLRMHAAQSCRPESFYISGLVCKYIWENCDGISSGLDRVIQQYKSEENVFCSRHGCWRAHLIWWQTLPRLRRNIASCVSINTFAAIWDVLHANVLNATGELVELIYFLIKKYNLFLFLHFSSKIIIICCKTRFNAYRLHFGFVVLFSILRHIKY